MLDEEGIDQALFFPSIHLLWGDIKDPEVAAETCRAYNDWMSDFCKVDSKRLFGMGIVPLQNVDLAVLEAKRLAKLGLRGLIIRPERFNDLALVRRRRAIRCGTSPSATVCRSASTAASVRG